MMKLQKAPKPFPKIKRIVPKNQEEAAELARRVEQSFKDQYAYLEREKSARAITDSGFILP